MLIRPIQAVLVFPLLLVCALPTPPTGGSDRRFLNPNSISPARAVAVASLSNDRATLTSTNFVGSSQAPHSSVESVAALNRVHPASLTHASPRDATLLRLLEADLTEPLISYLLNYVIGIVTEARKNKPFPRRTLEFFERWVRDSLLKRPKISTPVVMAALVYLERARPHIVGVGIAQLEDPLQSVFLGAMIVASKYTVDTTLKNAEWKERAYPWSSQQITRVEVRFLAEYLKHDASIKQTELQKVYDELPAGCKPALDSSPPRRWYHNFFPHLLLA